MDVIPDDELVRRCLAGDPGSWERITSRYGEMIRQVAQRVARRQGAGMGEADQEEVAAGVFDALVREQGALLRRYDPGHPLAAYLHGIARAHALHWVRSRRRRTRAESAVPPGPPPRDPGEEASRREITQRLEAALQSLPSPQQGIVRLYFYSSRTCPEIARMMGIPENTVYSALRRAIERLRDRV